jgi:hypothetical protein
MTSRETILVALVREIVDESMPEFQFDHDCASVPVELIQRASALLYEIDMAEHSTETAQADYTGPRTQEKE